jgi:hypothetical protein
MGCNARKTNNNKQTKIGNEYIVFLNVIPLSLNPDG